jgi:hypothetical protein
MLSSAQKFNSAFSGQRQHRNRFSATLNSAGGGLMLDEGDEAVNIADWRHTYVPAFREAVRAGDELNQMQHIISVRYITVGVQILLRLPDSPEI